MVAADRFRRCTGRYQQLSRRIQLFLSVFVSGTLLMLASLNSTTSLSKWRAASSPETKSTALHHSPPLVHTRNNRTFAFEPVTDAESTLLTQRDKSGITAAVCHRTLFTKRVSDISLAPLFAFVSYYRLLGFDHVFLWYRPIIANLSRFDELESLPFVTMTEYTGGGQTEGQGEVEVQCLSSSAFAADYNWTLLVDADEYLWFDSYMSVKDFLSIYDPNNYTLLSFGKRMYTRLHGVEGDDGKEASGFGLDPFVFTAGSYCMFNGMLKTYARKDADLFFGKNRTYDYCPWQYGRSKVLVKPAHHKRVHVHGMGFNFTKPGLLHFETPVAHLKEWRGILMNGGGPQFDRRPRVSFNVTEMADIVRFDKVYKHVDGKVLMQYDSELQDWMRFVASGCSN